MKSKKELQESKNIFLNTNISQIETAKILVDELEPSLEYLTYNIRRYKVPVTLILFHTEEDIAKEINDSKRLTDVLDTVKIGNSYFNFVFLLFTEEIDCYSFIKHIEHTKLKKINSFFYFEKLKPTIHNYYNFVNSYLFEIEKKESFF